MRVPYVVLILSLATTALVYFRVRLNVENREHARFQRALEEQTASIERRIPKYAEELFSLRGLFAANGVVTVDEWRRFLAGQEISRSYPGTRALGYLERVPASERAGFLKSVRRQGADQAHFDIVPPGEREILFPAVYVTRYGDSAETAPGLDHFALPECRAAMGSSRDTGQPMLTANTLVPGGESNGENGLYRTFLYLPMYREGEPTNSVAERRAALRGFVFVSLDPEQLLIGSLDARISCQVYDGTATAPAQLLRDSEAAGRGGAGGGRAPVAANIPVFNRTWSLRLFALPPSAGDSDRNLPAIALICWLTLSFLLFGLTAAEFKSRANAARITADLRRSEAALAAEKERLAVTLLSIVDGVITTDIRGRVSSINHAAAAMVAWAQQDAVGKPLPELFKLLHPTTRQPCANPIEAALRTGANFTRDHNALLVAWDNKERLVADSAAPILDRTGRVIGAVLVFRDVTAKQKSEEEMFKESKLESVGLLAGGIAHDFNNILQGILGNLSLARLNAHSTHLMLDRVERVEKSALRAKDLTQQLVMFARGGEPIRRLVQLNALVKDATSFALSGSSATCEWSMPSDLWPVEVDGGQFRQVINNIALNAVQAMPEGGKMEVRAENVELTAGHTAGLAAGKYIKISIRDHGDGIRPEDLPKIFDPYFTTRHGSRGLGLASAYLVVRKHGGHIQVSSQRGQGATFQIYLPASTKDLEAPAAENTQQQQQLFGGSVLVMDDEQEILALAQPMLGAMGFEVETARDGVEAIEKYAYRQSNGDPFTVVIMDLTIPQGLGGKETIQRLKVVDPQVVAIVSSGYSYDPVMANYQEHGFSGVMPKPYTMEDLSRVLHEVLGRKAAKAAGA